MVNQTAPKPPHTAQHKQIVIELRRAGYTLERRRWLAIVPTRHHAAPVLERAS